MYPLILLLKVGLANEKSVLSFPVLSHRDRIPHLLTLVEKRVSQREGLGIDESTNYCDEAFGCLPETLPIAGLKDTNCKQY